MWRSRVQGAIKTAKRSYYDNKVESLAETNPKKWWQDIKSLTGQDTFSKQEWHHQFLNDTINSPVLLAAQINDFFTSITHEFEPLTQVQTPPNVISSDLLVSLEEVSSDLLMLPTQKAVGPDRISNKLLKEFARELAPLIQDIYNQSLREGFVPDTLRQSIITPVPNVCTPQDIKSHLRPIALTSCLAKVLEVYQQKTFATDLWHYRPTSISTSWPLDFTCTNLFNASYTRCYRFRELLCTDIFRGLH